MNKCHAVIGITALTAIVLTSGCKKEDSNPSAAPAAAKVEEDAKKVAADTKRAADTAGQAAATETKKAAEAAPPAPATPAPAAAATPTADKTVTDAAAAASSQLQAILDKANSLLSDKKYTDALAALQQATNLKLTPEQQKSVSDLVAKIQTAMTQSKTTAADAANAAAGALGIKK